jgi:ATP/maltotriose-dependent transcriptional regulator MalT
MHRAELLKLRGAWSQALEELASTADRVADPTSPRILATVWYLQGELYLLRGDLKTSENAFRTANQLGRDPQPGLALLRLAQGKADAADAAIRRALQETEDPLSRARLLGPYVEIVLAGQADVEAARAASDELEGLAGMFGKPFLRALSAQVAGAVRLAADDAEGALVPLRQAWRGWRELDAPYDAARTRVLLARACRALGDDDGAEMELDAARTAFAELGAQADLDVAASMSALAPPASSSGLSSRELEVLGLLAKGLTNREIANQLVISDKTVASHVSHIFTKLDLTSRAAATGYAYEHGLV